MALAEVLPHQESKTRLSPRRRPILRVLRPRVPLGVGDPELHLQDSSRVGTENYVQLARTVYHNILQKEKDYLRRKRVNNALAQAKENALWRFLDIIDQLPILGSHVSDALIAQFAQRPVTAVQKLKAFRQTLRK